MPRNTSRAPAAARAFLICASLSGIVFSCELSSGFLSDSERSSLYELNLGGADGSSLQNGAVLFPGTGITALVAKKTGAADLASMDFSLLDSNGASAVALHLFTSEAPSAASNIILTSSAAASMGVPAIDGKLTGFKVPEGIAAGYYVLSVSIAGTDGSTLQKTSLSFFVDRSRPVIE